MHFPLTAMAAVSSASSILLTWNSKELPQALRIGILHRNASHLGPDLAHIHYVGTSYPARIAHHDARLKHVH